MVTHRPVLCHEFNGNLSLFRTILLPKYLYKLIGRQTLQLDLLHLLRVQMLIVGNIELRITFTSTFDIVPVRHISVRIRYLRSRLRRLRKTIFLRHQRAHQLRTVLLDALVVTRDPLNCRGDSPMLEYLLQGRSLVRVLLQKTADQIADVFAVNVGDVLVLAGGY